MRKIEELLNRGESESTLFEGLTTRLRKSERVAAIRSHQKALREDYPGFLENIVERARSHATSHHVLPGTGGKPCFVGAPPAWHENRVDDNEYIWSLNRMLWWPDLLWAWTLTGERRFAQQVVDEFYSWVSACPRPALSIEAFQGVTPWRSLEVGGRMFNSWPTILEHLVDSEFWTAELVSTYARSAADHAEVLSEICPIYWPEADHNHYLTEMIGLFSVPCYFPELAAASRWQSQAIRELERCVRNQLTMDGGQVEGCPGYHNHCISRLCKLVKFAGGNGVTFSKDFVQRIRRGVEYSVHSSRPYGVIVPWGDSDANCSHLESALLGWEAFGDTDSLAAALSGVSTNDVDGALLSMLSDLDDIRSAYQVVDRARALTPSLSLANWQHDLKQVAVRTAWDSRALSLFFACHTPVHHGGHAHMDPMGFDFCGYGNVLLADPGRFTYREGADRIEFKSATAHNTITIDRREPFEYLKKFDYGPQRWGVIYDVEQASGFVRIGARQDNYLPVVHFRELLLVSDRFLVVIDTFRDMKPDQSAELYFHLNSDLEAVNFRFRDRVELSFAPAGERSGLSLFVHPAAHCRIVGAGLLPGRISDHIDEARDSCRVQSVVRPSDSALEAVEVVSVAIPEDSDSGDRRGGESHLVKDGEGWTLRVKCGDSMHRIDRRNGRIICERVDQ